MNKMIIQDNKYNTYYRVLKVKNKFNGDFQVYLQEIDTGFTFIVSLEDYVEKFYYRLWELNEDKL